MPLEKDVIIHELRRQLELLKLEKDEDYKLYHERMINSTIEEREQKGVTWYPVRITQDFISTGERITVALERTKHQGQKHAFQVGSVVGLFAGSNEKKTISGVIGYLRGDSVRIVLNQATVPDWIYDDKVGMNLLFDDVTYREMNKAIHSLIEAKNNRLAELRGLFYGTKQARFQSGHAYQLPSLNEKQNEAFAKIVDAEDMAFVHGPPGTGKTTTLVKCIKETVRTEKQVLVCAPSNAAVDLLVERLAEEELDVLRLGHPARLTPEVVENSLDVRISKHSDFARLKAMRKQSEEYRSMARKYKRNFGKQEKIQREMLFKEAKNLKHQSRELESYISDNLVDKAQVIACTLTGASHSLIQDRLFKTLFIDEASQSMEAACWIPLDRVQRVIMSGDHFQLPPTIKSRDAAKQGLEETLFSKGIAQQPDSTVMLETQYRMEPQIMSYSSDYFYQGKLKAADSILHRPDRLEFPLEFIDTAGAGYEEAVKQETLSTYNEEEGRFLVSFLANEPLEGRSIGIIAPYKAQVEYLEKLILESEDLVPYAAQISVNTVDSFQGQERDLMYISLTRSNASGEIGFLKEYRRMNVAMTRARYRLVLIGDSATLGGDPFYASLIDHVQQNGKYTSVYEYAHLV